MAIGMYGAPFTYDTINGYASSYQPNKIHVSDTALSGFFQRYLIQSLMGRYKIDGMPDNWSSTYFYYTLFVFGFISVIETDRFGIIPQHCGLYGYDVQYQPTNATIANPLIQGSPRPRIGVQCALIKMQPDYGGCWDLVSYYADLMALASETAAVDLINSKLAYVFLSKNAATANSFKKLYEKIISGEPAAFADKNLFSDEGDPMYFQFSQNLKNNYIFGDIIDDIAKLETRFYSEIGLNNVNILKESGVSSDEVQANNAQIQTRAQLWLRTMQEGCRSANNLFGLNLRARILGGEEVQSAGINSDNV